MHQDLANRYAALWESSDSLPDVFEYLRQHADAPALERLEVLLRDQERRWTTAQPLKVSEIPDTHLF